MKRFLICCLIISSILCGCGSESKKIVKPVSFYYPVETITFNTHSGVIDCEARESVNYQSTEDLLSAYLEGPVSSNLTCPFPSDASVISVETANGTCTVVLSHQFAELTGLNLTIAYHCLGMTMMDLTGSNTVEIQAFDAELDSQKSIIITKDSFQLFDSSTGETAPSQE